MTREVAVVGAGVAGAGAAYALREEDVEVTVFEERAEVSGRAATRRRNGCVYDYGANYVKSEDDRVAALIERLDGDSLVDVPEPVWVFDADGEISEGRDANEHKWTYREGIGQLGVELFAETEATIRRRTRVAEPVRVDGGWRLVGDRDRDLGTFDAVVLTPPAPETADLLGAANWEHDRCLALREEIAVVPYRTILSTVLHYPFELDRPYYALVNGDKDHPIGWVSREECKPGHVPAGESLLIVQPSPAWSVEHYEAPAGEATGVTAGLVAELLGEDRLAEPDWTDIRRWRYALPGDAPDRELLDRAGDHDLFFAGDWVEGDGRIHLALRSGLEAGERVADGGQ